MRPDQEPLPTSASAPELALTTPDQFDLPESVDLSPERRLKIILGPAQAALANHGPGSLEFQLIIQQARLAVTQAGLNPQDTRLANTANFLLSPGSPLTKN